MELVEIDRTNHQSIRHLSSYPSRSLPSDRLLYLRWLNFEFERAVNQMELSWMELNQIIGRWEGLCVCGGGREGQRI